MPVPRWLSGDVEKCALISFSGGEFEDPLQDLVAIVQLALKSRGFYGNGDVDGKVGKQAEPLQLPRSAKIKTWRKATSTPSS